MIPKRETLRIFLCYASEDEQRVRELYCRLAKISPFEPWMDRENLLPGQDWDREIRDALRDADVVLICLSRSSVAKEGYVQREIRRALDVAEEKLESSIFIIPVRLEDCDVPDRLRKWQWVDIHLQDSTQKLQCSLHARAHELGLIKNLDPKSSAPIVLYDSDADAFATSTSFSPTRAFDAVFKFRSADTQKDRLEFHETSGDPLGANKAVQTLTGRVRAEYEVLESSCGLPHMYLCAIPMQAKTGLIEVGSDTPNHPANATSLYRVRSVIPNTHASDGALHTCEFSFDFRGIPTAAYTVIGVRINEGAPQKAPGRVRLVRLQLMSS
jgi:hypothetical protein